MADDKKTLDFRVFINSSGHDKVSSFVYGTPMSVAFGLSTVMEHSPMFALGNLIAVASYFRMSGDEELAAELTNKAAKIATDLLNRPLNEVLGTPERFSNN